MSIRRNVLGYIFKDNFSAEMHSGITQAHRRGLFLIMPFQFKTKEIKAEELTVKIEITLQKCSLDAQEVADRLAYVYNSSQDKGFSEFIVSLLRNARASTWELKKLEVE